MEIVNDDDMIMVASPNGRIYLLNRHTGEIRWRAETGTGALHLSYRRDDQLEDYLDLLPQVDSEKIDWSANNMNIYHFNADNDLLALLPVDDKEDIIRDCKDIYHDNLTSVDQTDKVYHFDRLTGHSLEESTANTFRVERRDFYINRPGCSLKVGRIMAWFPLGEDRVEENLSEEDNDDEENLSEEDNDDEEKPIKDKDNKKLLVTCEVYHSRNSEKYIQVCNHFDLHPLPKDSFLNELIIDKKFMSSLVTANHKFHLLRPLLHPDGVHNIGKHNITIHEGTWDGLDAILKKVDRNDGLEVINHMIKMIQKAGFHENLVNFYGRETDGESEFFAFEKCGITLHDYVKNNSYCEMSKQAVKIMSGLAEGVRHLHARGVAHLNLNPHNILVNNDDTIKICGLGNSKLLCEVTDGQLRDLHDLAHIILFIISNGQHNVEDVDIAPQTFNRRIMSHTDIKALNLQGTNIEAFDLFEKLGILTSSQTSQITSITSSEHLKKHPHFLSPDERLGFLKAISDYLHDGGPDPNLITGLENRYMVVVPCGSWFQILGGIGGPGDKTILQGMRYQVNKKGQANYYDGKLISLLRLARNAINHLDDIKTKKDVAIKTLLLRELGSNASELEHNLRTKFPRLLTEVYNEVGNYQIEKMKTYYP